jgi:hypothetical protein
MDLISHLLPHRHAKPDERQKSPEPRDSQQATP